MSGNKSIILELTDSQYQLWRHQPITAAFLQYLQDQAGAFRRDLLYRWENGHLTDNDSSEIRGIVRILDELTNLPLRVIYEFYGKEIEVKE